MRVFYVAIFATAALFATAIARPGFAKKRHARKARSILDNSYQQWQSNQNFDALPTEWQYNQLDQDSAVPHYPDFPQISNGFPQLDNQVGQERFGDLRKIVDELQLLNADEGMQNIKQEIQDSLVGNQMDQEDLKDLEKIAELHFLNGEDTKHIEKGIQEFLNMIRYFNGNKDSDQDSNGGIIPPVQKTHLPDLSQQTNDQDFGSPPFTGQSINDDSTGQSSDGIEPPVHKRLVTNLGQQRSGYELNTNNIDQYYGSRYPQQNENQNQDYSDYGSIGDSDYGSISDDDFGSDEDFLDEDDDSWDDDDDFLDEDFQEDSDEEFKSGEDQVGLEGQNKGSDGQGLIDPRLGNRLDDSRGQKKRSHAQRWKRSSEPEGDPLLLLEECMLICRNIRRTGKGSPVQSSKCDCANAPYKK